MPRRCIGGAVLLLAVLGLSDAVLAQTPAVAAALPTALDSYGEDDSAALSPKRIDPTDNRARQTLEQMLQYDPENIPARIQNAQLLIARGMRQRGLDEFEYTRRLAQSQPKLLRQVLWNYGWALFAVDEPRRALAEWREAERLHGGRPAWVPSTYAIALWVAGDRDLALDFYRSAVRSNPRRWGEERGLGEATRHWSPNEKLAIEAVYAAWRERLSAR